MSHGIFTGDDTQRWTSRIQRSTRLGIGLMLSSSEITRIAGAFGLDTSTRANIMSAVYTAQTAVHTGKAIVQAVSK